jgi:hypothetical protein
MTRDNFRGRQEEFDIIRDYRSDVRAGDGIVRIGKAGPLTSMTQRRPSSFAGMVPVFCMVTV